MSHSTIHLVDASLYIFRAWHSVPAEFFDADDQPVNAVYGFTRFLLDLLERARPSHCGIAFDESLTSSFRNAIYPEYKANRELPPEQLKLQFGYCQRIAAALGLRVLADTSYEADDLIGSVVHALRPQQFRAVIVSADKDFGQLIGEHDLLWDFSKNQSWDSTGVKERLGVHPHQVADYLALTGDAIDNIPGVAGIGAKTAATLLAHFGSLDGIYSRIEEIPFLRFRGAAAAYTKLKAGAALARLSRSLTGIACDCPVPQQAASFERGKPDLADVEGLLEQLRFGPLTRSRIRALT